ncbi:pilus assembly protein [Undibacterium sp. Ji50W]|uniref:pilus assembly protein n=1 Tax=Undibacterium sp. Ji50W TaxID=3413041 RepID=UPI003BF16378
MITHYLPGSFLKKLVLGCFIGALAAASGAANVTPSKMPLENIDRALSNVVFALSVEFPTGDAASYAAANAASSSSTYDPTATYYGYFDSAKCYSYSTTNLYFSPTACVTGTFKGNLLNWVSMANLDQFRQIMTGGNRIIDLPGTTVLQRAYNDAQSGTGYFPNRSATTTDANVTTQQTYRSVNMGDKMLVQAGGSVTVSNLTTAQMGTDTCAQLVTDYKAANGNSSPSWTCYHVRVKVCDKVAGLESNCTDYSTTGGTYKPEGLMQQYNQNMRFSAFGYLNDPAQSRQGGVLRARMKSVGPTIADPIALSTTNPRLEWSATTGVFTFNPDSTDQAATSGATNSGVINYLNQFGYASGYKGYDPMAELYYESLRYLRKISPTPQAIATPTTAMVDGFPVINFDATVAANDPITSSCQQNFIITIGDVNNWCDTRVPGGSATCSASPPSESPPSPGTSVNFATWVNNISTMESNNSNITASSSPGRNAGWYLGGLAYWAHVNDIRPDKAAQRITGQKQTVTSFFVDVMEPFNGQNPVQTGATVTPMFTAAKYGGFNPALTQAPYLDPNLTATGSLIKSWDKDGNGTPDNWYAGNDPLGLKNGLSNVFQQIVAAGSLGDGAAPATSGVSIASAKGIYYASYTLTNGGRGAIKACGFNVAVATCDASPDWDTSVWLDPTASTTYSTYQTDTARQIITRSGNAGVAFKYANLSATDKALMDINPATGLTDTPTLLGVDRVNYIRGDSSKETSRTGGIFRTRLKTKLGDIVGSGPVYVAAPNALYAGDAFPGYSTFIANNLNRKPVVYVGANDGMLHAFDASDTGKGKELFAYVPGKFMQIDTTTSAPKISALTTLTYSHEFYVDSTPMIGDVKLTSGWATLLVGSYGAGGKGYFALDVTDPTRFTETNAASISKWEFSDTNDTDMGYSYNQPAQSPISGQVLQITKIPDGTTNGKWAVIVGNGFGSTNGKAVLYMLDPNDGSVINKIEVEGSLGNNGLATPLPVATQGNGWIDTVWAGDLKGNMWRIRWDTATSTWKVTKAFAGSATQPITSAPAVAPHALVASAWAVVFGTGKYIERADYNTTVQQTIFGFADTFSATPITKADLVAQTITSTTTANAAGDFSRTTSSNAVDFTTKKGWYMDMPNVNGERSIVNSIMPADTGIVLVSSFTPATACLPGTGYVNIFNAYSGAVVTDNTSGTPVQLSSWGAVGMGIPYFSSVVSSGKKAVIKVGGVRVGFTPGASGPQSQSEIDLNKNTVTGVRFSWRQIR